MPDARANGAAGLPPGTTMGWAAPMWDEWERWAEGDVADLCRRLAHVPDDQPLLYAKLHDLIDVLNDRLRDYRVARHRLREDARQHAWQWRN